MTREKPVILAVDDDPQVLRSIARDLRAKYGEEYSILRADSGKAAVEALDDLANRAAPVALLLSDQRMPEMDGVAFLKEGRKRYPDSKRALLTAYADTNAAIAAINESQVDYYLSKPWDPPAQNLYPVIDDLLESWRAEWKPGYGGVRVVGSRWQPEAYGLKDFLARHHVPYEFLDVDRHPDARALLDRDGRRPDSSAPGDHDGDSPEARLPLVILPDGERLENPALADLAHKLGLRTTSSAKVFDFTIIGAGPAGLAGAVYGASEGLETLLVDREAPGGQAGTSTLIENYLGFPSGLSGSDLTRRAMTQATRFGVELLTPQNICKLELEGPYKVLSCADGTRVESQAILLAMGVAWRKLGAPGADRFVGRGIYYGSAMTVADDWADERAIIIGAGNSAGQAAVYLAGRGANVTLVVRGSSLGEKMSQYLVTRLKALQNVEIRLNSEIVACQGDTHLEAVSIEDRQRGVTDTIDSKFLFVFIGAAPNTDWLGLLLPRDRHGFILTGPDLTAKHLRDWPLSRAPYLLETSIPGIFAAGDVRHESIKRVASAVGEGSAAVHFVHYYLASL